MILVKIYGDKEWTQLNFCNKPIQDFDIAIDIATITRFRCKLKQVDNTGKKIRKWDNYQNDKQKITLNCVIFCFQ